ncbi:hypothetical protein ACSBM8_15895 [Sphingomonas sp. ASY06-1R]|uniref:hypothetical protein n=1 Tax=Sphingomonas sp. ASY06-1R TaxID=3445771 RepID=UPI003FA2D290
MLNDQFEAAKAELTALHDSAGEQAERMLAMEEKSSAQDAALQDLFDQIRQLRDEINALAEALTQERQIREQALNRFEELDLQRAGERRATDAALIKLEKMLEQQAADARTTAAILLARLEIGDRPR